VLTRLRGEAGWTRCTQELLPAPDVEGTLKRGMVGELLRQVRLLLLPDDFEQNLAVGGVRFIDPGFAEVFAALNGLSTAAGCW
jgi:hypothetical protein